MLTFKIKFYLKESEEWTAAAMAAALKLPISTLRRRIVYWQSQVGVAHP